LLRGIANQEKRFERHCLEHFSHSPLDPALVEGQSTFSVSQMTGSRSGDMEKLYLRTELLSQCDSVPRRRNRWLGKVDRQENPIDWQDASGVTDRIIGIGPPTVAKDRSVAVGSYDQASWLRPAPLLKARLLELGVEIV
jgi:hypothetical protein